MSIMNDKKTRRKVLSFTRDPRPEYRRLEEILLKHGCELRHITTTPYAYKTYEAEGTDTDFLFNYFTEERQRKIRAWFDSVKNISLRASKYKNYSLQEILEYEISVLEKLDDTRPLKWWYPLELQSVESAIDELRYYAALLIDTIEEIMNEEKPHIVLMWNGFPAIRRIVTEVARRMGIKRLYLERGYFSGTMQMDTEGVNAVSTLGRDSHPGRALSQSEKKKLDCFLEEFTSGQSSVVRQEDALTKEQMRDKLGIKSNTKVIFLPLQVYHDTNLLLFSKFSSNEAVADALMKGVRMCGDVFVVIKKHPESDAEETRRLQEIIGDKGRVIENGNIHSLIRLSDVIAVNNSTVGLEALAYFKPVLAFGESVYSNKGIVFKIDHAEDVPLKLGKALALNGVLQGGIKEMTESFLYRVIFNFLVPDPLLRDAESEERILRKFFPESDTSQHEEAEKMYASDLSAGEPLVSVIVPTYNRPDMLAETIKSILNQTFRDFEIIVVNDAGPDVGKIVYGLNQCGNITYVRHSVNRGLAASRNTGIKLSRGKYITYLDDDDIYYPDHIETLAAYLEKSEYRIAYTDANRAHQHRENGTYVTKEIDRPYSHDFNYDEILVTNYIPVLCFMHEKSCLDETGLFEESYRVLEDWDMWIRMSRKFRLAHIKKITAEFRWRVDGSTMTSEDKNIFFKTAKIIREKHKQYAQGKPHVLEAQRRQQMKDNFDECGGETIHSGHTLSKAIKDANRLITEGRLSGAISAYEQLVDLYPEIDALYPVLCDLCLLTGRVDIPAKWLVRAVRYEPSFNETLVEIASKLIETNKYEESARILSSVVEANPGNREAEEKLQFIQSSGGDNTEGSKDWRLHSGERQTAESLGGIRRDHVNRYKYVAEYIKHNESDLHEIKILDFFCGNGYGSYMLANEINSARIDAVDGSSEAVSFANRHFKSDRIRYHQCVFPSVGKINGEYDYIVAIESIEHVEDCRQFLNFLISRLKEGGSLFMSFPNKNKLDLAINPNPYHCRHFDIPEINTMAGNGSSQLRIMETFGQDVYRVDEHGIIRGLVPEEEMGLSRNYEGQFLMISWKKEVQRMEAGFR